MIGAKGLLRYPELNGLRGESGAAGSTTTSLEGGSPRSGNRAATVSSVRSVGPMSTD